MFQHLCKHFHWKPCFSSKYTEQQQKLLQNLNEIQRLDGHKTRSHFTTIMIIRLHSTPAHSIVPLTLASRKPGSAAWKTCTHRMYSCSDSGSEHGCVLLPSTFKDIAISKMADGQKSLTDQNDVTKPPKLPITFYLIVTKCY